MATDKKDIHEYADGWITERKGTDVPRFLKVTYVLIGLGAIVYLIVFKNGDVNNATRGVLVRQLNMSTGGADMFMYFVAALALVALVGLASFAFKKLDEH